MRKSLTLYFILLTLLFSCGQKGKYNLTPSDFSGKLKANLENLDKEESLPSKDTLARNFLQDSCTNKELQKILLCRNPLLRIISYRTIVNRKDSNLFTILLNHLDDTAKVRWWFYDDAVGDFMVSDLMIRKATEYHKLSKTEKNTLVDRILKFHTYLPNSISMMSEIEPQEKYYQIIKNKAEKKSDNCHDLSLLIAIAKFKRITDINFLKERMLPFNDNQYCNHNIFKAIENYPDSSFFPILETYIKEKLKKQKQYTSEDLKYYCRAIAQYRNGKSLKLLENILDKSNYPDTWYFNYNEEYVFKAIHKYKADIYSKLYNKLKPKMSKFIIDYLDKPDYDEEKTW